MTTALVDSRRLTSPGRAGLVSLGCVLGMVAVRAAAEKSMMNEHGPDAQMAIWWFFLLIQCGGWLTGGLLLVGLLTLAWNSRRWHSVVLVLLLGWGLAIGVSSWRFEQGRRALADARSPSTSPERLAALTAFNGLQAGYELDNRIASNPHATADVLRKLYRRDQLGTLMVLSRNPRTPVDVLQKLVKNDLQEEWIRKGLRQNPGLPEELRQKVNDFDPADAIRP